jgi:hypothetical protein
MDYPSLNFIRPLLTQFPGVSVDEATKLTIRLHYNPVMDEWVSLTDDVVVPREKKDSDILFDLHKSDDELGTKEDTEEVLKIGPFLESLETTGIRRTDQRLSEMIKKLTVIKKQTSASDLTSLQLTRNEFKGY